MPLIGTAAAIGLILFFVCAIYTHVRAGRLIAAVRPGGWVLLLAVAALVLDLADHSVTR